MKNLLKTSTAVSLASFLSLLISCQAFAKVRPLGRSDIAKAWIGLSSDDLFMFRVALRDNGSGAIAFSYLDQEPCVLVIQSWEFKSGKISLTPERERAACAREFQFEAKASGRALTLEVRNKRWKRMATLRPEKDFIDRWKRLSEIQETQQ